MDDTVIFEGLEELLDKFSKEDLKKIIVNMSEDDEFRNEMLIDICDEPGETLMLSLFKELNDIALENKRDAMSLSEDIMRCAGEEQAGGCSGCCSSCSSACAGASAGCNPTGMSGDEFGSFDDFEEPDLGEEPDEEICAYTDEEIEEAFDRLNFCYEGELLDYLDRYVPGLLEKEFVLSAFDLVSAAMHEALAAEASVEFFAFKDLAIEAEAYLADILKMCTAEEQDAIFGVLLNYMSFDFERDGMVNGIYEMLLTNFDEKHQMLAKAERLEALVEEAESYGYDEETFQGKILAEGFESVLVKLKGIAE